VYYKPFFKNTGIENQMFTDSLSRKSLILGVIFIEISCFWGDKLQCGLIFSIIQIILKSQFRQY